MTADGGLSPRQVKSQLEALAALREILIGHGVRCLLVEPVRLAVTPKWWSREYQAPYMEIRDGAGLRATVCVVERAGRRARFSVTRPGGTPADSGEVRDAKAAADHVLADIVDGGHGL